MEDNTFDDDAVEDLEPIDGGGFTDDDEPQEGPAEAPSSPVDETEGLAEENDPQNGDGAKRGVRQRLSEAEASVERLTGLVARLRNEVYNQMALDAGYNPYLLRSVGLDPLDHVSDDGTLNRHSLSEAIETHRKIAGLPAAARRPAPNHVAGLPSGGDLGDPTAEFSQALKGLGR